jgi:hypothetical protein
MLIADSARDERSTARRRRQVRAAGGDQRVVLSLSLSAAFDRLDDFLMVQGPGISPEAIDLLQEAAGVSESERRLIADRLVALVPRNATPHTASVLLVVVVGLFAAQFEHA